MNEFRQTSSLIFSSLSQKQPLIDGLKEAEKYGNNGDPIAGLSKIVVTVMSVVSNVVNKVVDVSFNEKPRSNISK